MLVLVRRKWPLYVETLKICKLHIRKFIDISVMKRIGMCYGIGTLNQANATNLANHFFAYRAMGPKMRLPPPPVHFGLRIDVRLTRN